MGEANTTRSTDRSDKRQRFATENEHRRKGASPLVLVAGLVVVIGILAGAALFISSPADDANADFAETLAQVGDSPILQTDVMAATSGHATYPLVEAIDGQVRLSLATFDDMQAHHYTYVHNGSSIEFFVLKSKDGVVRVAFNACDVCYPAKRGYRLEGDEMICLNCGRRFPADQINVQQGGCNPSPIERRVEGEYLVIQEATIAAGQTYF